MNIGVDLRALGGDKISGVKVYITSLLEEIFRLDKKNRYFLWWNSLHEAFPKNLKIPKSPRFKLIQTKFSNRKLNLRLSLTGTPPLDQLIMKAENRKDKLDLFWLPDPRPVTLSENCKLVTTIHDLSPTLYPKFFSAKTRVWHKLLNSKKIARRSDQILAVSQATAKDLIELWRIPEQKIAVTQLAAVAKLKKVPLRNVRKKYNLPGKFILSLSTLEPRKNLKMLIRAFHELKEEMKIPHKLVLAGDFDEKIFSDPKVTPLPFGHPPLSGGQPIHFTGYVEEQDKAALLSAADVFCFPSLHEGFGIPVLEAMQCGVPVLASDIPALREVCGDAAKFIPPKNTDAWKVALQKIISNDALREDLAERGTKQARKFSWEKCAKETIKAFNALK
jgi:glycosyltransferase involved in cell wall biosynthesis